MMQAYGPSDALLIGLWSGGSLDRSDGSCCLRVSVQRFLNRSLCGEVICGCQSNWAEHRGLKTHHNFVFHRFRNDIFNQAIFICLFLAIKITIWPKIIRISQLEGSLIKHRSQPFRSLQPIITKFAIPVQYHMSPC